MKKDVLISIIGKQKTNDNDDQIELMTKGNLYKRSDAYYLKYEESEATGYEGSVTTLKIEGNERVTMMRSGKTRSQLVIERGKRNLCHYDTGFGEMMIGIFGNNITSTLNNQGGDLQFKYTMDINTGFESENEVIINVRECN